MPILKGFHLRGYDTYYTPFPGKSEEHIIYELHYIIKNVHSYVRHNGSANDILLLLKNAESKLDSLEAILFLRNTYET